MKKKKRPESLFDFFPAFLSVRKQKEKKNSDFETLKVPRGKYLRRQKQSGDEEKKTIHSEYLLIFWLAIVF